MKVYKAQATAEVAREQKIREPHIVVKRMKYLILKKKYKILGHRFIYLDETYIHKNYLKTKILRPKKKPMRLKLTIGMKYKN